MMSTVKKEANLQPNKMGIRPSLVAHCFLKQDGTSKLRVVLEKCRVVAAAGTAVLAAARQQVGAPKLFPLWLPVVDMSISSSSKKTTAKH
jgi:hypothetical protein